MRRIALLLFILLPLLALGGDEYRVTLAQRAADTVPPVSIPDPPAPDGFPRSVIRGPSTAQVGDLLSLDFSKSTFDQIRCYVEPETYSDGAETYEFEYADNEHLIVTGVRLATRPSTTFKVELITATTKGIDRRIQTVVIAGGTVPPPVDPEKPPPIIPNATLPQWVFAAKVSKVTQDPVRDETADALAKNYRNWASAGATCSTVKQFLDASNVLNVALLTQRGKLAAWDAFNKALADKVVSLQLTTVPQYCDAWVKIAEGLERKQ